MSRLRLQPVATPQRLALHRGVQVRSALFCMARILAPVRRIFESCLHLNDLLTGAAERHRRASKQRWATSCKWPARAWVVGGVDAWGRVGPNNLFSHPTLHIPHPSQTPNKLILWDIPLRSREMLSTAAHPGRGRERPRGCRV